MNARIMSVSEKKVEISVKIVNKGADTKRRESIIGIVRGNMNERRIDIK